MRLSRRELLRVTGLGLAGAGTAAMLGCGSGEDGPGPLPDDAANRQPEVTRIRLRAFDGSSLCAAPELLAQDFFPREGLEVEYMQVPATASGPTLVSDGEIDFVQDFGAAFVAGADQGQDVTLLAGIHAGCVEVFARNEIERISDLAGKPVAVPFGDTATSSDYAFMLTLMNFVGVPAKVVVESYDADKLLALLRSGEIDAVVAYQPLAENLRGAEGIHVLISTADDPPFSNYFCCLLAGRSEFVGKHPVATKRVLAAYLKAADYMALNPEAASRRLVELGSPLDYEGTLHMVSHLPYGIWRHVNPEHSLRFYALRLREVGEISATPEQIIEHADWRFLDALKQDIAFAPGTSGNPYALSCDVLPGASGQSTWARSAPRTPRNRGGRNTL